MAEVPTESITSPDGAQSPHPNILSSIQPDSREPQAFLNDIGRLGPDKLQDALRLTIQSNKHDGFIREQLGWQGRYVRYQEAAKDHPNELGWLDIDDFMVKTVGRISAPDFWKTFLLELGEKGHEHATRIAAQRDVDPHMGRTVEDAVAKFLSLNNEGFYGLSNKLLILAAVIGKDFKNYIGLAPSRMKLFNLFSNAERRSAEFRDKATTLPAALEVAEQYDTPARSEEELLQRLAELFPDNRANYTDRSAIIRLKAKNRIEGGREVNAFTHFHERHHEMRSCPAVTLTESIYLALGQIIRTPEFQQSLHQNTTNRRAPLPEATPPRAA